MMNGSFEDRLNRLKEGDPGAREELLRDLLPQLRAYVRLRAGARIRSRESVSDLVQSVCREVLVALPDLPTASEPDFRRWLFTTALRKIMHRHEHLKAQKRDVDREQALHAGTGEDAEHRLAVAYRGLATPSRHAMLREEVDQLEQAFDRLPDDYREVLLQVALLGQPHREHAKRIGREEAAVRKLLSRARARLAIELRQLEG